MSNRSSFICVEERDRRWESEGGARLSEVQSRARHCECRSSSACIEGRARR